MFWERYNGTKNPHLSKPVEKQAQKRQVSDPQEEKVSVIGHSLKKREQRALAL